MGSQAEAVNALYPNLSAPQRRMLRSLAEDGGWCPAARYHGRTLGSLVQRGMVERGIVTRFVRITNKGREALGNG